MAEPFWRTRALEEMTGAEWESLCDRCARCCMIKLEDEETGEIAQTDVVCRLLDLRTCACGDYAARRRRVPECLRVTPELARAAAWLPPTCAYRLLAEGEELRWWHPLVSGDPETVHQAGISVRGKVVRESRHVDPEDRIVPGTGERSDPALPWDE